MPDADYFRTQAARLRRMAWYADERTATALVEMAEEYDAEAMDEPDA